MHALITGACGGFGRAMSIECAKRGYSLYLTDIDAQRLDEFALGLARGYGAQVRTRACNLTDAADTAALFAAIDAEGLRFDLLLNIAGLDCEGAFRERDCDSLCSIVQLNIEATLRVTHGMIARRNPGRFTIVNVSSLASLYPMPLKATYAASKRFLLDFSIALAQELAHEDISVLALCPAGMATTQQALAGIAAQGIWGSLTTNNVERVVARTLDKALAGRRVYVPGALNNALRFLGKLLPQQLVAAIVYRRWHSAQQKWLVN